MPSQAASTRSKISLQDFIDAAKDLSFMLGQLKEAGFQLDPESRVAASLKLVDKTRLEDIDRNYAEATRLLDVAYHASNHREQILLQIQNLTQQCLDLRPE